MKATRLIVLGFAFATGCGPDVTTEPSSEAVADSQPSDVLASPLDELPALPERALNVEADLIRRTDKPEEMILSVRAAFSDSAMRAAYPTFDGLERVSAEIPLLQFPLGMPYQHTDVVGLPDRYSLLRSYRDPYASAIRDEGIHILVHTNVGNFAVFVRPQVRE